MRGENPGNEGRGGSDRHLWNHPVYEGYAGASGIRSALCGYVVQAIEELDRFPAYVHRVSDLYPAGQTEPPLWDGCLRIKPSIR
ncbi:hypothetical protein D3C76_1699780 [compost metagenome]